MTKKKNKEISNNNLVAVKPITDSQKAVFASWKKEKNQFLFGCAGTGKTFISLYLALQSVMDLKSNYDKVVIVRSLIPTREIGFLPGMKKTRLHSIKCHIKIWFSLCLSNLTSNQLIICMIDLKLKAHFTFYQPLF